MPRAKNDLLFVYGTLKRGQKEARALKLDDRCEFLGPSLAQGILYDLGAYPGMRRSRKASERVQGELYRIKDPTLVSELDAYEGAEYLRAKIKVEQGFE